MAMIPGAPLSAPAAYRDLVTRWLCTLPDLSYEFALLDINRDGVLTLTELQMAVAPYGAEWAQLPQALMLMGDATQSGTISLAEFHQLGQLLQANAMTRQQLGAVGLGGVRGGMFGTAAVAAAAGSAALQQQMQLRQQQQALHQQQVQQLQMQQAVGMQQQVQQLQMPAMRALVIRWLSTFPDPDAEFRLLDVTTQSNPPAAYVFRNPFLTDCLCFQINMDGFLTWAE